MYNRARPFTAAIVAAFFTIGGAAAQDAPTDFERQQAEWEKIPDTPGTGPYPTTMEVDPAMEAYVVYRPADLASVGEGNLGVVAWGNGACTDDGASARLHLAQIASHGYLVIAPGLWRSGPNKKAEHSPPRRLNEDGVLPPPPTSAADLSHALDWAVAENERQGSKYLGAIDMAAIAVAGYSCGGVQALEISGDPRVDTVVIQNSGIYTDPDQPIAGMELGKDGLRALHTPVLYLNGGPTDIAYENGMDDFRRIDHVPAAMANLPVGHGGTYNEPNGGKAAQIVVDWLEWQLRGDAKAEAAFRGPDCGLCSDPAVTLELKNFD